MQRSKIVSGLVGAVLLCEAVGHVTLVYAQDTHQGVTTPVSGNKSYQSSGIRATIVSRNTNDKNEITIQLAINNDTKSMMYLFLAGNERAALDSGKFFHMQEVSGITHCQMFSGDDAYNMKICNNDHMKDINYYTTIDAGESTVMSIRFTPMDRDVVISSDSLLSFSLRFAMRLGPDDGSVVVNESQLSPQRVVTINIPLIQIKH